MSGWSLELKRGDLLGFNLTPQLARFLLGVVLGEPAAERAHDELPAGGVLELIDGAAHYGEGRGIRMTVRTEDDLASAMTLAALKPGE